MSATYEATATRSGSWWHIEVPDLEGVYTQVKRLSEGPAMIAEVLDLVHDLEVDPSEIRVRPAEPGLSNAVRKWASIVADANRANELAAKAATDLVRQLKAEGLTQSEVAIVMGVSKQRVSQLVNAQRTAMRTVPTIAESRELVGD